MKRITKLILKNFKRFENFEVEFKPDINVLVGDNETGKSSILVAIDLVLSGSRTKLDNYGLQNLLNTDVVGTFLKGPKTQDLLPTMFIELYLSEQNDFNVNGKCNSKNINCDGLSMICEPDFTYSDEIEIILKQNNGNFPFEFYHVKFQTFAEKAYSSHRNYFNHVLIDNSQINNEYAMREYIRSVYRINSTNPEKHQHQNEYRKYKNTFKENVLGALNQRLDRFHFAVKSSSKDNLESDLTLMEGDISIDNKGKGRQCFIKTQFALGKGSEKMDVVLLEEPENHLSHHHMKQLISNIADAKQVQLIVTTHNTMISTRLDLRQSVIIHHTSNKPLLLKDLPKGTAEFFIKAPDNNVIEYILSRKVILVEGNAEYMLMEEFYRQVSDSTLDLDRIHVISVGGISFKRYLDIAKILKVKTAVIRDNDGDHQHHCVENYSEYADEHIKIFSEPDNSKETFEVLVYESNKAICDNIFGSKRKKQTVLDYMLCHKSEAAYALADQKPGQIVTPNYIKSAIEWIRN